MIIWAFPMLVTKYPSETYVYLLETYIIIYIHPNEIYVAFNFGFKSIYKFLQNTVISLTWIM